MSQGCGPRGTRWFVTPRSVRYAACPRSFASAEIGYRSRLDRPGASGVRAEETPGPSLSSRAGRSRRRPRLRAAVAAAAQSLEDGCSLGRAQAGARVPAGAGVVVGVAAGRDVVEGLRVLVQDRVDEPGVVAQLLVDPGDQSRPQGCHGARAAEGEGLAVHQTL